MKKNSAEIRFFPQRSSKTYSTGGAASEGKNGPAAFGKKDSSSSVNDDDNNDGEELNLPGISSYNQSSIEFEGVRFTPKVLEFQDAFEGKSFVQKLKLQNVGKNPVLVRMGEPKSFVFQMDKHDHNTKLLATGSTLVRFISYTYHNDDLVQKSVIPVQVNNRLLYFPIVVNKAIPVIEIIPPELDFKSINMGASAKTLKFSIHNTGGQGTKFTVDLGRNELDLVVRPMRGTIRAKNQISVYVEMSGVKEGEYYKELWITTSEQSIRVPVIVEVLRPRLEVYHPNKTGDFTLIDFPPTFIGTQRLETLALRNISAEMTPFVALAEINGEVKNMKEARKLQDAFKMFMLSTEEGRFEPFESKISTIMFKPVLPQNSKGWHRKDQTEKQTHGYEYLIFLRIIRVHCIERRELEKVESEINHQGLLNPRRGDKRQSIMASVASTAFFAPDFKPTGMPIEPALLEPDDDYIRSLSELLLDEDPTDQSDAIRLCIHGEAIEPNILVQPSEIEFKKISLGEKDEKVIRITNLSTIPVKCIFSKAVNVVVSPDNFDLNFEKGVECSVEWTPTYSAHHKVSLDLKIYAESAVLKENDESPVCVKTIHIGLKMHCVVAPKDLIPKIGLGITPLITNEVGILAEKVTFGSPYPKPKAAILETEKANLKPAWTKKGKIEDAIIAFPNDRPQIFYNWPKDKVCRTIFTGNFRYSPPQDPLYALAEEDFKKREKERLKWAEYLKESAKLRKENVCDVNTKMLEYQVSCEKLLNRTDFKFPKTFVSQTAKSEHLNGFLNRDINLSEGFLMPLSPLFLCNIKVEPKLIDLAMVAPNSSVKKTLKMHNMNSFPICIRFIPGKSGVTLPGGDTKIIYGQGRKSLEIVFQTKDLGRYNGFLDYVINGSHQFKITISANVMPKTLVLNDSNFEMEFSDYSQSDSFQPRSLSVPLINRLQSPIKFHWDVPYGSSFKIEPASGEVPPLCSLQNEIYFSPEPEKVFPTEVYLISESGASQTLKLVVADRKPKAYFLSDQINLDNIPLNLREKTQAVIRNADYFDVIFEVLDFSPIPGVTISPQSGIIKARGFTYLDIQIQIPIMVSFSFNVTVQVQHSYIITLTVNCQVTYPLIRLTPTDVTMRRISAQSFDVVPICVENYGTTMAHISIDFKHFPEYSLGRKKLQIRYSSQDDFFLQPGKCMKIFIKFEPSDIARHQFYLPIIINGMLGPPFIQNSESEFPTYYLTKYEEIYESYGEIIKTKTLKMKIPCTVINCSVVGHSLKISTLLINFQPKKKSLIQFQSEEIKIMNPNSNSVAFCIRTDDLSHENSPFSLVVVDGGTIDYRSKSLKIELEAYESVILRAEFTPCRPGIFKVEIPIYIRGYNDGAVYNYIILNGEMKKPTLVIDINEVHFPPLPLEVGSEVTINVTAEYYQTQDLIYAHVWDIIADKKNVSESLHIKWLEEPFITGKSERQTFQIRIWFQSATPVSLRTFIVFSDSTGEYVPILVTASADNSAITNHSFLSARAAKFKYIREYESVTEIPEEPVYPVLKRYSSGKKMARFPDDSKKSTTFFRNKNMKDPQRRDSQSEYTMGSRIISTALDPAPKLKIFPTKSATRLTQLNYYSLYRIAGTSKRDFALRSDYSAETASRSETLSSNTLNSGHASRTVESLHNEITYPYFPSAEFESKYGKDMNDTLIYVERWISETVFHCDQYFTIPGNCQILPSHENSKNNDNKPKLQLRNIFDLLVNLAGESVLKFFSKKLPSIKETPVERMERTYLTYFHLLRFFWVQGAVLPHIRPENLLTYDDYLIFSELYPPLEKLTHIYDVNLNNPLRKLSESITSLISVKSSPFDETASRRDKSLFSLPDFWSKPLYDEFDFEKISKKESVMYRRKSEDEEGTSSFRQSTNRPERDFYYNQFILDETTFLARTTQAWLDVIIQLFRTLVLRKVTFKRTIPVMSIIDFKSNTINIDVNESNAPPMKRPQRKRSVSVLSFESYESNVYTAQERVLLTWLNHHYEIQRNVLWPYGNDCECSYRTFPRTVDDFTTHLSDCVVLTAVTASHCPYLVPNHLLDVFPNPATHEQVYHNAIKLTHAWREVNLGLTVEPKDLVYPNLVFMIMLIVHLYENLPTLSPRALIRFSAHLTQDMFRNIQLTNHSSEKVCYQIKFIGNDGGFFRTDETSKIYIKPHKNYEFKIYYHAKRIQKITAFLILCGATESPKFSKHITLQLEGEPSDLIESSTFKFTMNLYKMVCTDIPIEPPYSESAEYEIWYATTQPKVRGSQGLVNLATKKWDEIWNRKVSRRFFLNQSYLFYNKSGKYGILNASIMCLSLEEKKFWLLFRNPNLGDFIVKIQIAVQLSDPTSGELRLILPDTWKRENKCTCSDVDRNLEVGINIARCFLLTTAEIPAKNETMWEANFAMFKKTLMADERQFWTKHFETKIGIRLVSWLLSQDDNAAANEEFLACLSTSVKYHLKLDWPANIYVKIPSELKIPDVQSPGTVTLPLHISGKTPIPFKMLLTMTAEDGREVRTLRIILQERKSESSESNTSSSTETAEEESSHHSSETKKSEESSINK